MTYQPTAWKTGDIITEAKINNLEDGVSAAHSAAYGHWIPAGEKTPGGDSLDVSFYDVHSTENAAGQVHLTAYLAVNSKVEAGEPFGIAYSDNASDWTGGIGEGTIITHEEATDSSLGAQIVKAEAKKDTSGTLYFVLLAERELAARSRFVLLLNLQRLD